MWVAGILMTLSCVEISRHYLIMSFPLEWVWLSRLGLSEPRWGKKVPGGHLGGTAFYFWILFLGYIHVNHGALTGDYGTAYQYQTP